MKSPVTIKLVPDGHVQLIRAGEMRMRLKFGYKERLETAYRTPIRYDSDCYLYERTACKFERPSHSRKGSDRL